MHAQNASYMPYFEVLFKFFYDTLFIFIEQPHFKQLGPILGKKLSNFLRVWVKEAQNMQNLFIYTKSGQQFRRDSDYRLS